MYIALYRPSRSRTRRLLSLCLPISPPPLARICEHRDRQRAANFSKANGMGTTNPDRHRVKGGYGRFCSAGGCSSKEAYVCRCISKDEAEGGRWKKNGREAFYVGVTCSTIFLLLYLCACRNSRSMEPRVTPRLPFDLDKEMYESCEKYPCGFINTLFCE